MRFLRIRSRSSEFREYMRRYDEAREEELHENEARYLAEKEQSSRHVIDTLIKRAPDDDPYEAFALLADGQNRSYDQVALKIGELASNIDVSGRCFIMLSLVNYNLTNNLVALDQHLTDMDRDLHSLDFYA